MKSFTPLCTVILSALSFMQANAQDNNLKLNQLQVIGSHNSYKTAIEPALYKVIYEKDSAIAGVQYEHVAITDQLNMGLRNLEIDIYADSKGGKYAHPKGLELAKPDKAYDPNGEMNKPGFKIIHMVDVDFRSSVLTFEGCLQMLKKWSDEHPGHIPVFITLEPKDGYTNQFGTTPEPFTPQLFDEADAAIRANLGNDKLITPDMVRGKYATLEEAVLKGNWPTLKNAKGKFFFLLDDSKNKMKMYVEGHPSLKGRVAFVNAKPGTPEAAAMFRNESDKDIDITDLVKKGYIIRTRADLNTVQARMNDYSLFELAKKSGAQIITTDYYQPSKLFKSTYQIKFEDGKYVRTNPVNGTN
ncbi:phosphatidylinositol-specific phospholipase C1-like protein [Flavobacterium sp. DG1-102-2]|uniref:phosphatidylinositol-specific phospholipase C1-like protein n=1 Tax=Flavobacterium sp. DG1-102-2 TaxID=3081663 RepID=UPI0029498EA5|nr:phosphatidylinositol-specific phospholipase C1-like protein [Flavobacterium sp. DG1-102-2]MDV6166883.1 phosphatidylinositol-specific phospholipase C1-like protein [Flavobacterium sp. DG1-102-2]